MVLLMSKTRREEYLCGMHEIEMHERALLYRLLEGTAEVQIGRAHV